ncbi:MAG: hypothetical protein IPL55_18580 [Saprospiraceae bacterium]|nr:hypothetical protein [Saprospiraceae bacterium]
MLASNKSGIDYYEDTNRNDKEHYKEDMEKKFLKVISRLHNIKRCNSMESVYRELGLSKAKSYINSGDGILVKQTHHEHLFPSIVKSGGIKHPRMGVVRCIIT